MRSHGFSFRAEVGCVRRGIDPVVPQYGALGRGHCPGILVNSISMYFGRLKITLSVS